MKEDFHNKAREFYDNWVGGHLEKCSIEAAELTTLDEAEKNRLVEHGHSMIGTIQDLHRRFRTSIIEEIMADQGISEPDSDTARLFASLTHNFKFSQILGERYRTILEAAIEKTQNYAEQQIATFLGEKTDFEKIRDYLDPELYNYATTYGYRQRVFDYQLPDESMPQLLASSKNLVNIRSEQELPADRESIEYHNMLLIDEFTNSGQLEQGDTFIEISPPVHAYQTEIMLRFSFRGENGWEVEQLSIPFPTDLELDRTEYYQQIYDEITNLTPQFTHIASHPTSSDMLSNLLFVPQGQSHHREIVTKLSCINRILEYDQLAASSNEIKTLIAEDMDYYREYLSKLWTQPTSPRDISDQAEELNKMLLISILKRKNREGLVASGFAADTIDEVFVTLDGEAVYQGTEWFDEFVGNNTTERISVAGDCGELGYQSETSEAATVGREFQLGEDSYSMTRDGNGNMVLNACPVCGAKNLPLGTGAKCHNCGQLTSDIHEAFFCGKDASGNSISDMRTGLNRSSMPSPCPAPIKAKSLDGLIKGIFDILLFGMFSRADQNHV